LVNVVVESLVNLQAMVDGAGYLSARRET